MPNENSHCSNSDGIRAYDALGDFCWEDWRDDFIMTKEELMRRVNFKPVQIKGVEKVKLSTKLTPYVDNERSFIGFTRCSSNVLAKENDAAAMAMCKDSK